MTQVGTGKYSYELIRDFPKLPPGESFGMVSRVATDSRILALEYVDAVLRVGRHPADHPERFARRQFRKIADQLVGIFARADLCHCCFPPYLNFRPLAARRSRN